MDQTMCSLSSEKRNATHSAVLESLNVLNPHLLELLDLDAHRICVGPEILWRNTPYERKGMVSKEAVHKGRLNEGPLQVLIMWNQMCYEFDQKLRMEMEETHMYTPVEGLEVNGFDRIRSDASTLILSIGSYDDHVMWTSIVLDQRYYVCGMSALCDRFPEVNSKTSHVSRCAQESILKRGRDTKIPQSSGPLVKVGDEAVHKELGDRMERAATTASSLEAEQDSGAKISYWGMWMLKLGLRLYLNKSYDPPLSRGYTLGSGEDSMKLLELMELCTQLLHMLHKNRKSDLVSQKK
ncbi:hypothetical protein Tco_0497959 [Tanacetum coccineum]